MTASALLEEGVEEAPKRDELGFGPGDTLGDAVFVGFYEDGSPEWHAQRANVYGGSDVGDILGIGFNSKYVKWLQRAGVLDSSMEESPILEWGHRHEDAIAKKFSEVHPDLGVYKTGSWINKAMPLHGANPDRLLVDLTTGEAIGALEIKTSVRGSGWENGKCPEKYVAQLRWYLGCFGFEFGYLVVLIGGIDYLEFYVPADASQPVVNLQDGSRMYFNLMVEDMQQEVKDFHASLPTTENPAGTPPEIDGKQDTYDYLREKNMSIISKGDGAEVELSEEVALAWATARAAKDAADLEYTRMAGHLLAHMGTAKFAKHDGKTVAARQSKKTRDGKDGVPFLVAK